MLSTSLAMLLMLAASNSWAQPLQDKVAQSSVIFRGTVLRLEASTIQLVAASPNTIVVRVDEVIPLPESTIDYTGREVTLRVKDPSALKVGDKAVFYAKGWLLADGVALVEVDHDNIPLTGAMSTAMRSRIAAANQEIDKNLLRQRRSSADILIQGKVVSTEPVEEKPLSGNAERPRPISEHSPQLRKATIEVIAAEATVEGSNVPKVVTVLYPASQDVRWKDAPRFERGDVGVFILSKADKSVELKDFMRDLKLRIEDMDKFFFGPSPLDFRPNIDLKRFNELIKPSTAPGP